MKVSFRTNSLPDTGSAFLNPAARQVAHQHLLLPDECAKRSG